MNTAYWSTVDTPAGPFTAIVSPEGAVVASGWTAKTSELVTQISATLLPKDLREKADLGEVTTAIQRYHDGDLEAPDGIPVVQRSGEFMEHAWDVLRTVPAGKPITYMEYAMLAGRPAAIRAAAGACARNAAALFVPCHRIIRTGGGLGGFRWGLPVKSWLLAHEES